MFGPSKTPRKHGKPASNAQDPVSAPVSADTPPNAPKDALNTKRDRESARSRTKSAASREIGPLPPIADPARREACRTSLAKFCLTYFPATFPLPFSPAHFKAIEKLERGIIHGGLFALAMPRGNGKTTLCKAAGIWSLVYSYRRFVCLIGATEKRAEELLIGIKRALASETLAADFPEICAPIRAIENDARRCTGQIVDGKKTNIVWTSKKVTLPEVEGSRASGSIISIAGITGSVRGQNHTLPTGEVLRPELVILDDPQTRESAWSDSQCQTRLAIVAGDVLGLSGPSKKIAAVCPCTVIRRGDMADQLLDRQKSPEWQGERTKMLATLPSNDKLWEEYAQLRVDSLRADGNGSEATEFYRSHREAMDAGAVATWPERYEQDEISAVQCAMNLKLRDEDAFLAEAQNEPREIKSAVVQLKPDEICQKLNGHARGTVPTAAEKLTAFVDIMDGLFYYAICAWSPDDMAGWIIDYGTFPEQQRRYFTLRQASPTLASTFPGLTKEALITRGLESLTGLLLARSFPRDDGAAMPLDRLLIDQGYMPTVLHNFIRSSGKSAILMPSKGIGIGAASKPMTEYQRKPGELLGTNWMVPKPAARELRHVRADVNHWKTFVHSRLALPAGTKGALTLYGTKSGEHRLLADHLCAEFGTPTEGHGRQLTEWRHKPGSPDNHWLDCIVGCAVAASMIGCGKSMNAPAARKVRPSYRKPVYLT